MTTDLDDLRKPHREMVLHWRDDLDAWERIAQNEWEALDWECEAALGRPVSARGIAGIPEGERFFVVVFCREDGVPFRVAPHRYLIGLDGGIVARDALSPLSPQEREEQERLLHKRGLTKREKARYDALTQCEIDADFPPRESLPALRCALGPAKPGSNAERFFAGFREW